MQHESEAVKRDAGLMEGGGRGRKLGDVIKSTVSTEVVDGVKYVNGVVCGDDKRYHPPGTYTLHLQPTPYTPESKP